MADPSGTMRTLALIQNTADHYNINQSVQEVGYNRCKISGSIIVVVVGVGSAFWVKLN